MKRKIFFVRHGESADKQTGQSDFDRSLTQKGKISVELLGNFFKSEDLLPDRVVSSPARRASETSMILSRAIGFLIDNIEYDPTLYNGTDEHYLNVLNHSNGSIAIIGHNPSISYAIGRLINDFSVALHPGQCAVLIIDDGDTTTPMQILKLIGPFYR